ncbi:hypothetical protein BD410DRAFT_845367 [Rickenella mellea]|uniref:DUF6534 domain-containing protein n=1 Tax=Rickenella mellea TaxID=50990 RepID=A0A4Y7PL18_9AGAM|nr:hypothetical protein BD410DRAFT_845367 [Rickenella mellea]
MPPSDAGFLELNFWGFLVSLVLLGVSICQAYLYFTKYNDWWPLKLLVLSLLTLDISATFLWSFIIHKILILSWGSPKISYGGKTLLAVESVVTILVTVIAQLFFAYRVYLVGGRKLRIVPILVVAFALLGWGSGIARVILMVVTPMSQMVSTKMKVVNTLEGGFAAVSDIIATVAMVVILNSVLRTLLIYTFNRGIVVTAAQVSMVVLYLCGPQKFYWNPVHMCLTKLYVNTLLAMLNARAQLRSQAASNSTHELSTKSATEAQFANSRSVVLTHEMRSTMERSRVRSVLDISTTSSGTPSEYVSQGDATTTTADSSVPKPVPVHSIENIHLETQ